MNDNQPPIEYRCPGEKSPISRAVHLGRLAAFYPACRECPHREDTGSLSPRQVEQLTETAEQRRPRPLFNDEGAGGVYLDEITPADARRIAAAFGVAVGESVKSVKGVEREERNERGRGRREDEVDGERDETEQKPPSIHHSSFINPHSPTIHHSSFIAPHSPGPSVLLAGDGRPISAELVASAADGLRWSGCDVIDIGPATAPCLAFAVHHLKAAGGVMVGNPGMAPHEAGLQFWTAEPRPLSAGAGLERLKQLAETELARPTRRSGSMSRFQADEPYLAALSEHYHALRPLRVAVDSASKPTLDYLRRLSSTVACEIVPFRSASHFAVQIDGDGETCLVFDEQGREAPPDRLLKLLARYICDGSELVAVAESPCRVGQAKRCPTNCGKTDGGAALRLTHPTFRDRNELDVLIKSRADVSAAMRASGGGALGFGPGARYWHAAGGVPLPDALMTVTWLLKILSHGDEQLSGVLDRDVPEM
ncbi:MAG: hypothetical protein GX594_01400 [Pirellulaceae bacterium]|nr:hypothetical protein [Pirellulaceae bacterium]